MSNALIIGLLSSDQLVYWFQESDMDYSDNPIHSLHSRMSDWLVNGNTFTILEYHPEGSNLLFRGIAERAEWWDQQLHNQGYDIRTGA